MAFRQVTVYITQPMINKGVPKSATYCPIHMAIERLCRARVHVAVSAKAIHLNLYTREWIIEFTGPIARFRLDYDDGHPVVPLKTDLRLPNDCLLPSVKGRMHFRRKSVKS